MSQVYMSMTTVGVSMASVDVVVCVWVCLWPRWVCHGINGCDMTGVVAGWPQSVCSCLVGCGMSSVSVAFL